uniref:Receptor-like serine/threonine-protein kinase n=1 Tax=Oryza brachyantha TaxID=4533 RepID=J3M4A8_ORYBR
MAPLLSMFLGLLLLFSLQGASPCSAANDALAAGEALAAGDKLVSRNGRPSSAANDALAAGEALAAGDKLVSRNGRFALGFFRPSVVVGSSGVNITSPDWYVGIWFDKISEFTTVWVANRDDPITETQLDQAQLKLSEDGNLVISSNASIIWSSNTTANTTTAATAMNATISLALSDNGNLVIGSSPTSNVLWQSFDNPSDVMLPGTKFGWNKVTGATRMFVSKKNSIDPGLGLYYFQLDSTGIVLARSDPAKTYWFWSSKRSSNEPAISLFKQLMSINPQTRDLINMTYVDNTEEEYFVYFLLDESYSVYGLLDISGQLQINVWSEEKQSWQQVYTQPISPCTAYATCGPFTVCNGAARPFCGCMESFSRGSPRDWELGNRTAGCSRDTPLDCSNTASSTDVFHAIARVQLPSNNPQTVDNATSHDQCAKACLSYCSCNAYSYQNSRCSVWHGDLLSVNKNDGIDNSSEDVLYLRLAARDVLRLRNNRRKLIVGVVIGVCIFSLLAMLMLILLTLKKKLGLCGAPPHDGQCGGGIMAFRYNDLCHATKNFSEKLGGGGFGSVFKGVLSDSTTVAVKRLDGARQGEKQFRAEVSSIGLIQHINLVKLIGFCCKGDERLLVYEHMLNGSLDVLLFQSNGSVLDWATRYNIIIGVARGLSYLHQSCQECIIHCDIKPENILLNTSFVPKIADFGMAAFVGRDFSRILTTFRGTIGYLAPEWISGVAITPKVDVYSFGMVLFEILSGRRNTPGVHIANSNCVTFFPLHAITKLHEGDVHSLVDTELHGNFSPEEAERVCKVACWCIQDNEFDRPTMSEVVRVLEGLRDLDVPPMPRLLAAITKCSTLPQCDSS